MEGTKLPSSTSYLAHCAFGHVFALLFGTGHLMPSEADESHEGIEVMLEQCRAQNRQLVSEMRKPMSLLCIPYLTYLMFLVCFIFSFLSGQAPPYLADTWFQKVLDVSSARLPTAYTTHLATEAMLLPGHVLGTASQSHLHDEDITYNSFNILVLMFLPGCGVTSCLIALYEYPCYTIKLKLN